MSVNQNDLYTTWGRGFANALDGICLPSGQDAYEVVVGAFSRELNREDFHALGESEFARLSDAANSWLETNRIEAKHMRDAVAYLCKNWPLDSQV